MNLRRSAISITLCLLSAGAAVAQPAVDATADAPAPPTVAAAPPVQPVPDATLQALRGHVLSIQQRNGSCVVGELVGFDAASVTVALAPSRNIMTMLRSDVAGLQLADTVAPAAAVVPRLAPLPPDRPRHFGLQLGLAPGLMVDVEAGHFYGFAHADLVLPLASSSLLGFSAGAGATFTLAPRSRWKIDIFLHVDPVTLGGFNIGVGAGLGFHYTSPTGFTVGFKIPIIGYSGYVAGTASIDSGLGMYYLGGLMGLPVVSLGYRF